MHLSDCVWLIIQRRGFTSSLHVSGAVVKLVGWLGVVSRLFIDYLVLKNSLGCDHRIWFALVWDFWLVGYSTCVLVTARGWLLPLLFINSPVCCRCRGKKGKSTGGHMILTFSQPHLFSLSIYQWFTRRITRRQKPYQMVKPIPYKTPIENTQTQNLQKKKKKNPTGTEHDNPTSTTCSYLC